MATLATPAEGTSAPGLAQWLQTAVWNVRRSLIITRREVRDMFRDWRIIAPIILLTVIFPFLANWGAGRMTRWVGQYDAEIVGDRLIPFLLMIVGFFPISFSLIIALESFVGEKERRSLEPLLSTPVTDTQLYIGKMLSSTVPPLVGSLLGIAVYLVGVYINVDWKPSLLLLVQIIMLNVIQALVMVSGAVVVSSQTTSVRAANLLASFIIIPMAFLIQGEALIMFWANYSALWWIMLGLAILNVVLVRMGIRIFNREELLGNEIDELNLGATFRRWYKLTLARKEDGTHRSAWRWYREEVFGAIGRMKGAVLVVTIALIGGLFLGMRYARVYAIPGEVFHTEQWYERFQEALTLTGFVGAKGVLRVAFQNVRALFLASLLAVFSFGTLAILILMLPLALVGYLGSQMVLAGINPLVPWASILPHSILELPAAVLAGAAAVRIGASVLTTQDGKTVGQGWVEALADATRLWVTLILPVLLLAAVVEIYLTPLLVRWAASGL
jgi:uncharacterized membrane protein SpoIIM required for sporulation/ABC-type transport system involved in multi-copper enzyme maturation permease subunit